MRYDKDLTKRYPECFIEYVPVREGEYIVGIECWGDSGNRVLCEIEKAVDIRRAKKAGCRGAVAICKWLNGDRR